MQRMRLAQLVNALQGRLGSGDRVWLVQGTNTAADAGRHFPVDDFRRQLTPERSLSGRVHDRPRPAECRRGAARTLS